MLLLKQILSDRHLSIPLNFVWVKSLLNPLLFAYSISLSFCLFRFLNQENIETPEVPGAAFYILSSSCCENLGQEQTFLEDYYIRSRKAMKNSYSNSNWKTAATAAARVVRP